MSVGLRYNQAEVQEHIAQGYVLGTLSPTARRRCETLRAQLPELDQRIGQWSEHLQPLADEVPELAPSPHIWEQLEASIAPSSPVQALSIWDRLPFIRGLALVSSLFAIVLGALLFTQSAPPAVDYIAVLVDASGQPQFVATASETNKQLEIRNFTDSLPAESDYQLWALSKTDGEIRSLGLIAANAQSQKALSESDWRLIGDAQELLVSAESPGGSAIGEPSEDIVSRGLCVRLSTG